MKISVDTEIEEISELKAAIAIIEDAVKRRENPEPEEIIEEEIKYPSKDNKTIVKNIILELAKLAPNQPIKMEDIIKRTDIPEEEVFTLIDELQKSGEI